MMTACATAGHVTPLALVQLCTYVGVSLRTLQPLHMLVHNIFS